MQHKQYTPCPSSGRNGGSYLDKQERQADRTLTIDRDAQINVVVNRPDAGDEVTIDLGRVFHTMKLKSRIYAWVLVLCMVVGLCAPLLMYQFSSHPLTVSSVVTLAYGTEGLVAPDGSPLDLSQITGSYVLQNALQGLNLSHALSQKNLKANLKIERFLTDDSRRMQEVAAKMVEDKNAGAYTAVQGVEMTYENRFVVSLTNGFGDADTNNTFDLKDDELRLVLDRVLSAYNDYLVTTYSAIRLPEDKISIIDPSRMDVMESLELLRTAEEYLYEYCEKQTPAIRSYRSYKTGRSLNDWMSTLETGRSVAIDYLYSYVYTNSIVRDRDAMITRYQYQIQTAQNQLDTVKEKIAVNQGLLQSYKNDEIYVSSTTGDASRTASTTTDYYNALVLEQAQNFESVADLETRIEDMTGKIKALQDGSAAVAFSEGIDAELKQVVEACTSVQEGIRAHMLEIQESSAATLFAEHTAPQGKAQGFLAASMKNMIIGAVAGAVIACGLWFLAGLAPEFRRNREASEARKEAL